MEINTVPTEPRDRWTRSGPIGRHVVRAAIFVSAVVALSVGTFTVAPVGAADPGTVAIAVGGSVDCPSGNKTVEVTASYEPTDDVAHVELGSATVTFDDADGSVTRVIVFDPATLTPQTASAVATATGPGGASVTITVPYTVTMTDGGTHEATTAMVLDVAAPPSVCPRPPASTEAPTTTEAPESPQTTTENTVSVDTAPVARPAAAQPSYTG